MCNQGRFFTFQLQRAPPGVFELARNRSIGIFRHQHFARARRLLKLSSSVDSVTDYRKVAYFPITHVSHEHLSGRDSSSHSQRVFSYCRCFNPRNYSQGSSKCPFLVVSWAKGSAEESHHLVAYHLIQRAVQFEHRPSSQIVEPVEPVHCL